jgi:hypothetical protein
MMIAPQVVAVQLDEVEGVEEYSDLKGSPLSWLGAMRA